MMYVYILKSRMNGSLYIGTTNDLARRIREHNKGLGTSTKRYMPWQCVYFEGYAGKEDARTREHNLKYNGRALTQLKLRLQHSLSDA